MVFCTLYFGSKHYSHYMYVYNDSDRLRSMSQCLGPVFVKRFSIFPKLVPRGSQREKGPNHENTQTAKDMKAVKTHKSHKNCEGVNTALFSNQGQLGFLGSVRFHRFSCFLGQIRLKLDVPKNDCIMKPVPSTRWQYLDRAQPNTRSWARSKQRQRQGKVLKVQQKSEEHKGTSTNVQKS